MIPKLITILKPSIVSKQKSLQYWREFLLHYILLFGSLMGAAAYLPGIYVAIKRHTLGIAVIDTFFYLVVIWLFLSRKLDFKIKVSIILSLMLILGSWLLVSVGPLSAAYLWLFSFSVMTAVLLGGWTALGALILDIVVFLAIGLLFFFNKISLPISGPEHIYVWIILGMNFILLNTLTVFSIAIILRGLKTAIENENASAVSLRKREKDLIEINKKLQKEISQHVKAEKALKESERRFRDMADLLPQPMFETDMDGKILFLSKSGYESLGYSPDNPGGLPNVFSLIGNDTRELFKEDIKNILKGRNIIGKEYSIKSKSGGIVPIIAHATPIAKGDKISGFRGIVMDIRERKKAEEFLLRSEKMAALGELVAGIAHEISTPLGVGLMSASFLTEITHEYLMRIESGKLTRSGFDKFAKNAKESSELIHSNLVRAADLIKNFKQIAVDQSEDEERAFNLKTYVEKTLTTLKPKYKRTEHSINLVCPDNLQIHSFPGAFSQIITNLVMNSLIHGFENTDKGEIRIEICALETSLKLTYMDNGMGMPEKQLKKIFDPFYTTKRNKGGSGLGMNIVYNLVTRKLGGAIDCWTSPGKGMKFFITLPLSYTKSN